MRKALPLLALAAFGCATPPPTIPAEGLSKPIDTKRGEFLACYVKGIAPVAGEKPRGKVRIRFSIAPDGKVLDPRIAESELSHSEIEGCLLDVVRGTPFAATGARDVVVVHYPLEFKP